jgi:hypothetical protein
LADISQILAVVAYDQLPASVSGLRRSRDRIVKKRRLSPIDAIEFGVIGRHEYSNRRKNSSEEAVPVPPNTPQDSTSITKLRPER